MPTPEEVFAQCDELGLARVEAMLKTNEWGEPRKKVAQAWLAHEQRVAQEDQHEESIEALKDAALQLVKQMSESSAAIGEKMDGLGENVETLDERLSSLNTTIEIASESSSKLGIVVALLTTVIAVAAGFEIYKYFQT